MKSSFVDSLAAQLTSLTDTKFEVLRDQVPVDEIPGQPYCGRETVRRYMLRTTRKSASEPGQDYTYAFRFGESNGLNVNQMKAYLATLCDMIQFGFLPIETKGPPVEKPTSGPCTVCGKITTRKDPVQRVWWCDSNECVPF